MNGNDDLAARAKSELSGMAKQGMDHPSTKPVLIGAGLGAVAGALLPVVSLPAGLIVGAGIAFWQRIKK
ncbi:hypothetical protein OLX02_03050 [Novosphingobium sp. KCTC 2891]|uniref:hypothetical protein n=1 Tax=Novosphingobium sp. KCTC 2891 TaxID=2989730 RepID=UPI00222384C5|nr:hypothetical protein [Novosphingobium sp. KCTC 2891]MCW1381794.1 hypothetical protein [Novosphingobium sp. KCTC 2891]